MAVMDEMACSHSGCLGEAQNTGCQGQGVVGSWAKRAKGVPHKSATAVFFFHLWKQAKKYISGNDLSLLRANQ